MNAGLIKLLCSSAILAGCGGSSSTATGPTKPILSADAGTPKQAQDADTGALVLTEDDCEILFQHVFALALSHQQHGAKDDEKATAADLAKAKSRVRTELFGMCVGASREGFNYDCAIAAADVSALTACMRGESKP
ncbi:MAG: hypothetical protein JKY56_09590 [Kofleriaceae bacterium]|nr:hypothetical protein [Kofleriaceae bacterium]